MKYGKKFAIAVLLVLALPLVGCVTNNPGKPSVAVDLPQAPAHYVKCFNELTPAAEKGKPLTRGLVVRLIADLTRSDKRHTKCGKALLHWYDTVRKSYSRKA